MMFDVFGKPHETVGDLPPIVETHAYTKWLKSLTIHQLRLLVYKDELKKRKDRGQFVFDFPL